MTDPREEMVVLVDERDAPLGAAPKSRVHATGERHRAVSVFLFDGQGRLLLQQRATGKYHSPGLWSNTCCGHPRPGESALDAARRRLREEMGVECELKHVATFEYRAPVGELIEHEVDHVFTGSFNGTPAPDANEVGGWSWRTFEEIVADARANPSHYSIWFPIALDQLAARGLRVARD